MGERETEGSSGERETEVKKTNRQVNRGVEADSPKEMIERDRESYRRRQIYCTHIVTLGEYMLAAVKDRISHFLCF